VSKRKGFEADGPYITLDLDVDDSNDLKKIRDLGTDSSNTYMKIIQGSAEDMVALPVLQSSYPVTKFVKDTKKPLLVSFSLDMSALELSLVFDETVDCPASLVYNTMVFTPPSGKATSGSAGKAVRLKQGSTASRDGTVVVIKLDTLDADALKLETSVVSRENNTNLVIYGGGVADAVGNPIASKSYPVAAGGYKADTIKPKLLNFAVDMNASKITLNFDEPVDSNTLKATEFTLQGATSGETFTLTDGSTASSNGRQVVLKMTVSDMNIIKQK